MFGTHSSFFYTTNISLADVSVPQVMEELYGWSGFGNKLKGLVLLSLALFIPLVVFGTDFLIF